jgi:hydroxymethylpyrimidine/phosphomethylpyrimidine kinase
MKVVLAIAASDCSGAAGLWADLKAIAANGGYGACVLTAVTAQNRSGVARVQAVDAATVAAQLQAVLGPGGLAVAAIKSGVLGQPAAIAAVARALHAAAPRAPKRTPYVLDPVMVSTSGHRFMSAAAERAMQRELLPLCTLATPNAVEAAALLGLPALRDRHDAERAGRAWLQTGCAAVLVKGGHLPDDLGTDVLVQASGVHVLEAPAGHAAGFGEGAASRGTGCSLASAIATHLGRGRGLLEAVRLARRYLGEAVRQGNGESGAPDHLFMLRRPAGWRRTLRLEASAHE